jgi:transposase
VTWSGSSGAPIEQSQSRQVLDLPEMPTFECVEHWTQKRPCACGHLTGSSFLAGVSAPVCYGPRSRALGDYLVSYQHLPYERAAEIVSDWAGAPISVATLQAFVARGAEGLEEFLVEIRSQLTGAEVAHFYETGGRVDGWLQWIPSRLDRQAYLVDRASRARREGDACRWRAAGLPRVAVHDNWRRTAISKTCCTRCAAPTTCVS